MNAKQAQIESAKSIKRKISPLNLIDDEYPYISSQKSRNLLSESHSYPTVTRSHDNFKKHLHSDYDLDSESRQDKSNRLHKMTITMRLAELAALQKKILKEEMRLSEI